MRKKGVFLGVVIVFLAVLPVMLVAQQDTVRYGFCPSAPVVRDHEGNVYRTVQIGAQCWMAENMRCTTSPSGHKWYSNPYFSASQPEYAAYYATPTDPRHGILLGNAVSLVILYDLIIKRQSFCQVIWL